MAVRSTTTGFQQFTSFFNPDFSGKLRNASMDLSVTVGANEDALLDFSLDPLPGPRGPVDGNAEIFLRRIRMVKLEGGNTASIAAHRAGTAFEGDRHFSKFFPALGNRLLEVIGTLGIVDL
jgi:hypothetical protein